MNLARALFALVIFAHAGLLGCGGSGSPPVPPNTPNNAATANSPSSPDRIIVVVMENQDYAALIGNPSAPYLNGLAQRGGLQENFYANTHPSIGNYFMMTTGQIVTNDSSFNSVVTVDNLARRMIAAGRSWKVYAESLPHPGYLGSDVNPYVKRHNPFAYFSDVVNDPAQAQNIVGFGQLATDLAANRLPDFSFVVPNNYSNMHDCPPGLLVCANSQKITYGDNWLRDNIEPVLASPALPSNTIFILTFDEAGGDSTHGGSRIVTIFAGPRSKSNYRSTTFYQMQDLLATFCHGLRLTACPGAGASGKTMLEMLR
jgi:phosphatidylinositol-3-phosphatase